MAISVRVRIAHRYVDFVIIMLQRKLKTQRVEVCGLLLVDADDLAGSLRELSGSAAGAAAIDLLSVNLTQRLIILIISNIISRAIPSDVLEGGFFF